MQIRDISGLARAYWPYRPPAISVDYVYTIDDLPPPPRLPAFDIMLCAIGLGFVAWSAFLAWRGFVNVGQFAEGVTGGWRSFAPYLATWDGFVQFLAAPLAVAAFAAFAAAMLIAPARALVDWRRHWRGSRPRSTPGRSRAGS